MSGAALEPVVTGVGVGGLIFGASYVLLTVFPALGQQEMSEEQRVKAVHSKMYRLAAGLGATTFLLGMLAVDLVFDTTQSPPAGFVAYYCTLLPSLSTFPEALRVVLPCAALAGAGGINAMLPSRTVPDLVSPLVLLSLGLPTLMRSVWAVSAMCDDGAGPDETQDRVLRLHLQIGAILLTSLLCQLVSFAATLSSMARKQKDAT